MYARCTSAALTIHFAQHIAVQGAAVPADIVDRLILRPFYADNLIIVQFNKINANRKIDDRIVILGEMSDEGDDSGVFDLYSPFVSDDAVSGAVDNFPKTVTRRPAASVSETHIQ